MAFEIGFAFQGKLREHYAAKEKAVKAAVTRAMSDTAKGAKAQYRSQISKNFKRGSASARAAGQDLQKAVTAISYPDKRGTTAIDPAAIFVAKPEFMPVFVTGAGIIARGRRMVIALPPAVRLGFDRSYRQGAKGRRLRKFADIAAAIRLFGKLQAIPARNGDIILAADVVPGTAGAQRLKRKRAARINLFLLVKSVLDPKLFDYDGPVRRAVAGFDALVERYYKDPQ